MERDREGRERRRSPLVNLAGLAGRGVDNRGVQRA